MIQRIQSVYLLLAALVLSLLFVFPFASAPASTDTAAAAFSDGVYNLNDSLTLLICTGLALLLSVVAIFLFKNRLVQSRITSFGMFAATILAITLAVQFMTEIKAASMAIPDVKYGLGIGMPAISVLLLWLANRAIRKDEALVRSSDRLR